MKAGARDYSKELNYQEACAESYVAYAQGGLPEEVEALLQSPQASREGLLRTGVGKVRVLKS